MKPRHAPVIVFLVVVAAAAEVQPVPDLSANHTNS